MVRASGSYPEGRWFDSTRRYHFLCGPVVQLVRMPACHAGGRRFEPDPDRHFMVGIVKRPKTQGCGSCIHGFESHYPPHKPKYGFDRFVGVSPSGKAMDSDSIIRRFESFYPSQSWRHSQVVRQRSAKPLFPSSNLGVASKRETLRSSTFDLRVFIYASSADA